MAKSNLESLLKLCASPLEGESADNAKLCVAQQKAFHDVTRQLVREVTSPNETVRHQVRRARSGHGGCNSMRKVNRDSSRQVIDQL